MYSLYVYDTVSYTSGRCSDGEPWGRARAGDSRHATIGLLIEASYELLTIDAVAARARSSKTTIYRRWTNKAELVRAAVENYRDRHQDLVSARGQPPRRPDRRVAGRPGPGLTPAFLALMGGLMQAMRADEELRRILWPRLVDEAGLFAEIVDRRAPRPS